MTAVDNFASTASTWRRDLGGTLANHVARCCTRMDALHGQAITRSVGEVDRDAGEIIVEVELINFNGANLTVRASMRITQIVIVPSDEPELRELATGIGSIDLPPDGDAA